MEPDNLLTTSERDYVLAKEGEIYAIYFPEWENNLIDLREYPSNFSVSWFNPRTGDGPHTGDVLKELYPRRRVTSLNTLQGGNWVSLGPAPYDHHEDWVVVLKKFND
ncbi:MAG: hypothetical protein O3C43_16870 [Verrucomicrobia bacterium]|nr:hypothetical protein [Verrucomicrobiota bacterium]MDA1068162.1 hypothetical protein [Verrucomicrobiota bacterium]